MPAGFSRAELGAGAVRYYHLGGLMASTETSTSITLRQLEDHLWQAADLFRNIFAGTRKPPSLANGLANGA
jgi:hypothetical protein